MGNQSANSQSIGSSGRSKEHGSTLAPRPKHDMGCPTRGNFTGGLPQTLEANRYRLFNEEQ